MPDTTYDPRQGWTLDQFAMQFEPNLLREYKDRLQDADRTWKEHKYERSGQLEFDVEFNDRIKKLLMQDRFRLLGFRPGSYALEEISRILIEDMKFEIVTGEFWENRTDHDSPRRFEKVRVFDKSAEKKMASGRKETYDWKTLKTQLERENLTFSTEAELIRYCIEHVRPMPGKVPSEGGADDNTTRPAIKRHGLKKFIKSG